MNAAAPLPMPSLRGRNHEIWVGLFVLAGIVAVLYVLFTLTSPAALRGRTEVTTVVGNASGIRRGDPVQMRGVNIGRVKGFELVPQGVVVRLEVEKQYPIPADSKVELRSSSLLGEMVAQVLPGTSPQPAKPGQALPGVVSSGPFGMAEGLAREASQTLNRVQGLLNEETVKNVGSSIAQLNESLRQISSFASEEQAELRDLTASLRHSAKGVEGAVSGPQLARSLNRLDEITARLDTMSSSLGHAALSAETVTGRIERGEGSLGLLTRDESLYVNANSAVANLNRAAEQLTELTADIRRQPKRYFKISVF